MAENPYAAPSSKVADVTPQGEYVLADRASRLAAALLDGLIVGPGYALLMWPIVTKQPNPPLMGIGSLYLLIVLVVEVVFLYRYSGGIGKRIMKIKIIRADGSGAGLDRTLGLRIIVNSLPVFIPVVGRFYGLIDVLFIFGEPRRCIHDYLAGTIVVNAT